MNDEQVAELLAKEVEKIGSVRKWAIKHKIDYAFVSRVMNLKRPMSMKIAKALGLKKIWVRSKTM